MSDCSNGGGRKVYYYKGPANMGDYFNEDLCERILKIKYIKSSAEECEVMLCGSLLDDFIDDRVFFNRFKKQQNIYPVKVWGSGFIANKWECAEGLRKILPERFIRPFDVYAVRGQLSYARIQNNIENHRNVVLADPGILASYLIDMNDIEKRYSVGIIPHQIERGLSVFDKLDFAESTTIDVSEKPTDCIKKIAQCEIILSSSLHGLIFADALGIPNARIIASDRLIGGDYKFDDYYSGYHYYSQLKYDIRTDGIHSLSEIKNHFVDPYEIKEKQMMLMESFPK